MNKHSKRLALYFLPIALAILVSVVLRTIAIFTELDYTYGRFDGKGLILAANISVFVFAVFALSYLFFGSRELIKSSFHTPMTYIPSGLIAVCLLFLSAELFTYGKNAFSYGTSSSNLFGALALLSALFTIPSSLHFFFNAYDTERKSDIRALFALCSVVFFALYSCFLYFNTDMPLNAPNKIVDQLALLFFALFLLYETRISLGRDVWGGYIAFGLTSALLLAYSSIPSIILYFVKGEIISMFIEENFLTLFAFLFVIMRLILIFSLRSVTDDGGISAIEPYAISRMEHVADEELVYKTAFVAQMSIDDLSVYNVGDENCNYEDIEEQKAPDELIDEVSDADESYFQEQAFINVEPQENKNEQAEER